MSRNRERNRVATWSSSRRPNGQVPVVSMSMAQTFGTKISNGRRSGMSSLCLFHESSGIRSCWKITFRLRGNAVAADRVRPVHRHRGVVVVEGAGQPERRDRRTEAPAQVREAAHERRRQPEVVGAQLPVVLPLAEPGVGERLARRCRPACSGAAPRPGRGGGAGRPGSPSRAGRPGSSRSSDAALRTQLSPQTLTIRSSSGRAVRKLSGTSKMIALTLIAGLGVLAAVDEAVVAVGVLGEAVAVPGERARRAGRASRPGRAAGGRVVVEQGVALELQQRLRDGQLAHVLAARRARCRTAARS